MSDGTYNFPRLDKPDSEKEKERYHEDFGRAIIHRSITDDWANNYTLMAELYKFLEEGSEGELTEHLQKSEDGSDLPALWLSLNTIPSKIDTLIGEMETRGYRINVKALNKEAIARKLEEKEKLRVERRLQSLFQPVDEQVGFGPDKESSQYIPQTDAELDEYADLKMKDKGELIIGSALKWLAKKNDWDEERKALLRDIFAVGRCYTRHEIHRGLPINPRVSPLNIIFDTSAKRDDLLDSTFWGELDYMPISAAAEKYNLSDEQIEKVYNAYNEFQGMQAASGNLGTGTTDYSYAFSTMQTNRMKWFKSVEGDLRVLVARTAWRDYKHLNYKDEKNEETGAEFFQMVKKPRKRDNVKTTKLEVWRQCTIIGGAIVKDWGECPNQPRSVTDFAASGAPYSGWVPNFSSGRGVSKTEQLAKIQLMKDVTMYNMELAMMRAGAKGMSYDLAMLPPGWTPEKAMKYTRTFGFNFYNSKEYQFLPNNSAPPFKEFDMTISSSIDQYLLIMKYFDNEMDRISGVSPERQGAIQGASQGLGVTQAAIFQSNLITQPYFKGFERFCSRVLTYQSKLVQIAWPNKEQFAPIIGDAGVDFLREHVDIELDEYGVVVESLPPMIQDRQKFEQLIMLTVQADPTFIDDAIPILLETDIDVAVRKFQRRRALKAIYQQQQAEQEQQQQEALEAKLAALDTQRAQQQMGGNLALQESKNRGSMEKTLVGSRTKMQEGKMKLIGQTLQTQAELDKLSKQQTKPK